MNERDRERARYVAMVLGTSFQHALLRLSNALLALGSLGVACAVPSALQVPAVAAGCILVLFNTFLTATDEDHLVAVLEDLDGPGRPELLPAAEAPTALPPEDEREPLSARSRELWQKAVRCRKELARELKQARGELPGIDADDAERRLETLVSVFRTLAARRTRLERSLAGRTPEDLLQEAEAFRQKAKDAAAGPGREGFASAAEERARHAESHREIQRGIEAIEAKLTHVLTCLESYRARVAALTARGGAAATGAQEADQLVKGLAEGAEDLEKMLQALGQD